MPDSTKEAQTTVVQTMKTREETTCCVVGGGPAGAMLALLLARQGIAVTLLEEHTDFARDFRGDTVHPSILEILDQIGLAERVLALKRSEIREIELQTPQGTVGSFSFRGLHTRYPYIALIPQEDFLDCITTAAREYASFRLIMGARAEKLIEEDGYVHGVQYRAQDGWHELRAVLTVGADGRFSRLRKLAGLEPITSSPPMDVLWFRLPRRPDDPGPSGGKLDLAQKNFLVLLERGTEWQIAYVINKGGYQAIKAAGLENLRATLGKLLPTFTDRLPVLVSWKQISVLSVESSILTRWYRPGLLLIGDAAHVMTPVAGVGINYAIQDAVATVNLLGDYLKRGQAPTTALARVQTRRELPTKLIQAFQKFVQQQILARSLTATRPPRLSWPFWLMLHLPLLRAMPARFVAFGVRHERLKQP